MDIKTFVNVASHLPSDISVLVRGPTGVGKSDIIHQIAGNIELPVIDRRLSQMTEGDIIGLPQLTDGITRFAPVDWLVRACNEPVVLFLDEINRATVEVQQCAFQLVLDRELNGHKLHPLTRIFAAINQGSQYQVNDMGPALLRRFWAVDLEPTTEDWIKWATGKIDPIMVQFIRDNPAHLRYSGNFEPGKIYPNPAAWHRLDRSLKHAGWDASDLCGNPELPSGFYALSTGFVGIEPAISFVEFVKNYQNQFSAEDITCNWKENKERVLALSADKHNDIIEKLLHHCSTNKWSMKEAKNIHDFVSNLSGEVVVNFFNQVMETEDLDNIRVIHKLLGNKVVELVRESRKV